MDRKPRMKRRSQSTPGFYRRIQSADRSTPRTFFRQKYDSRDIPARITYDGPKFLLKWTSQVQHLDFEILLPLFADGLMETAWPYSFISQAGINDLIHFTTTDVLEATTPSLISPLSRAIATGDVRSFAALEFIRNLVELHSNVAGRLVPHYKRLFGSLRTFYLGTSQPVPLYARYGKFTTNQSISDYLRYIVDRAGISGRIEMKSVLPTFE